MKSLKSFSFSLRLLLLSALITIVCVMAGGYIFRTLVEREKEFDKRMRPNGNSYAVMRILVRRTTLTPPEIYNIVEKQKERRSPFQSVLVNGQDEILDFAPSEFAPIDNFEGLQRFKIAPNYFVMYKDMGFKPQSDPRRGPNPFGPRGGHHGPPPEVQVVGAIAIGVSVLVGLGLSVIFLSLYIRRKSKEAEIVISKLRGGDLKARFKVNQVNESSELMQKFNEMADQIEGLVSNLRATEKARMVLLQELAHDLRTPVASLKNLQEILLEKGHLMEEDKRRHAQGLAVKEVHYFERLVEDLLFLSGVNDPRYSGNFKPVLLNDLFHDAVELFETERVKINLHTEEEITFSGDEHLLKRLIKNAVSNASRFAKTEINITLTKDSDGVKVSIQDDGPGLDPSQLDQFGHKKYSRAMQASNDNISIGLGSVIMKKIMSLHDGDLKVENVAGSGLKLTLIFPQR